MCERCGGRIINEWQSLHLLLRMHLLRTLFARNEAHLSELPGRTGASAAAKGRGIVDLIGVNPQGIEPCGFFALLFAVSYLPLISILNSASSCICFLRQLCHVGKEGWRLADEKPHIRQELERAHGDALCLSRSNDRTAWKASTQERAWFRHDQVIGEQLVGDVQVGKCH